MKKTISSLLFFLLLINFSAYAETEQAIAENAEFAGQFKQVLREQTSDELADFLMQNKSWYDIEGKPVLPVYKIDPDSMYQHTLDEIVQAGEQEPYFSYVIFDVPGLPGKKPYLKATTDGQSVSYDDSSDLEHRQYLIDLSNGNMIGTLNPSEQVISCQPSVDEIKRIICLDGIINHSGTALYFETEDQVYVRYYETEMRSQTERVAEFTLEEFQALSEEYILYKREHATDESGNLLYGTTPFFEFLEKRGETSEESIESEPAAESTEKTSSETASPEPLISDNSEAEADQPAAWVWVIAAVGAVALAACIIVIAKRKK